MSAFQIGPFIQLRLVISASNPILYLAYVHYQPYQFMVPFLLQFRKQSEHSTVPPKLVAISAIPRDSNM